MSDEASSSGERSRGAQPATALGSAAQFVALRSGLTIRHYVIEEVIGAGGFGITYRARHDRLKSKIFALKEFFPREFAQRTGTEVVSTAEGRGIFRWGLDRFLKEAEALAKCEHPSIVDVVDYFEANGTAYAVLGYVEGQQFGHWLDGLGRPPTQAELDRILVPLLSALEVVHEANLLHRDIAPDNILIDRRGNPILIDFGACREDIRERSQKVSAIVKHGYSPAEQYHGLAELQGPWTDIYAMGATLYRAISGAPPMDSARRGALGDSMKPSGEMARTDYRPQFLAAIDHALRLKPEERPRSVPEWSAQLLAGATVPTSVPLTSASAAVDAASARSAGHVSAPGQSGSTSSTPLGPSAGEPVSPPPPRRAAAFVTIGAVLVLGGLGAFAFLRNPGPEPAPAPKPGVSKDEGKSALPGGDATQDGRQPRNEQPKSATPPPPQAPPRDRDAEARDAWDRIRTTREAAVLERYLAEHGASAAAAPARQALAALRAEEAVAIRERAAADTWRRIADTADRSAIERFLAEYGTTRTAEIARARLSALALQDGRQRELDQNLADCRAATDALKATTCARVINSDDTPARRAEALQQRGLVMRKQGDFDGAIADLTRSLELQPRSAPFFNDRGIAHFLKGGATDRDAAIRDYTAAIDADPRHAEALNNRAWARLQAGDARAALLDADQSIRLQPANGYAYDTRGHIYEALNRRDDAVRDYQRAIQLDPTQETSRAALTRLQGVR